MKTKLSTLLFALLLIVLNGCHEESDIPKPPIDGEDEYVGIHNEMSYSQEMEGFYEGELVCIFRAESGQKIRRKAKHIRSQNISTLTLDQGLKEGVYEFLSMQFESKEYPQFPVVLTGFGARLKVTSEGIQNMRAYSSDADSFGSGTKEDPYIISADDHLYKLSKMVNDVDGSRSELKEGSYFLQLDSIDMGYVSFKSDNKYGWRPIGNEPGRPFVGYYDGGGYPITGLNSKRDATVGVGLFGFINNSVIKNVTIQGATIEGLSGVSPLVGNVVTGGNSQDRSVIRNCKVQNCNISTPEGGLSTAGILGSVDGRAIVMIDSCQVDASNSISGSYGVGGIVGCGLTTSSLVITNCINRASICATYTGAGGIVGLADSLIVMACINEAPIMVPGPEPGIGGTEDVFGAGGIVGGAGVSVIVGCQNTQPVKGYRGVGGIIGSTLINKDQNIYNNCFIQSCKNEGTINAQQYAGGICGEVQGTISNSFNLAKISSQEEHVGGIVGYLTGGSLYQVSNFGQISGTGKSGGIVGKTDLGIIGIANNFGTVNGNGSHVGGILGLGGSATMIHYSSNFSSVSNASGENTGGIAGMIGDVRDWDAMDVAQIVVGAIDMVGGVLSFASLGLEALSGTTKLVLTVAGKIVEYSVLTMDITMATVGNLVSDYEMSEEVELWAESLKNHVKIQERMLEEEHNDLINGGISNWNITLEEGLSLEVIRTHFQSNQSQLRTFYNNPNNDYENSAKFNEFINKDRNNRQQKIIESKEQESLIHTIISGVCLGVATLVVIAGTAATLFSGGTTLVASLALAGGIVGLVGGSNTISGVVDDFAENACIIEQCINAGDIEGKNNTAGLIGNLEQNCVITDCINIGNRVSSEPDSRSIAKIHSECIVENCLNIGKNWEWFCEGSANSGTSIENCYSTKFEYATYENKVGFVDAKSLGDKSQYKNWSIIEGEGTKEALWNIPDVEGAFPIPYTSYYSKKKDDRW